MDFGWVEVEGGVGEVGFFVVGLLGLGGWVEGGGYGDLEWYVIFKFEVIRKDEDEGFCEGYVVFLNFIF